MDNLTTPDPTVGVTRQAAVQEGAGTSHGSRSAEDSPDNLRLPDLIAHLRAAVVAAEHRAELAEALAHERGLALKRTKRKRPKRVFENPEYAKAMRRQLIAWGPRVADGDPSDLRDLRDVLELGADIVRVGAVGLHDNGTSWTQIGDALGISRQGARQQWGRPDAAADRIEEAS